MARRTQQEEKNNQDRWLVSYADFITLLLAFFVAMYSISSVNEGKYRVLSDSLSSAFGRAEPAEITAQLLPMDIAASEDKKRDGTDSFIIPMLLEQREAADQENSAEQVEETIEERDRRFSQQILDKAETEIDGIATDVEHEMVDLIDDDIINVKRNKFWLEVEVKSSLLFPSGSSRLIPDAVPVLVKLSEIFVDLPNRIHVEGFTDNKPINTLVFPSNWELSAARAAAVVRLFERNGVEPSRMASIGYGEYHPIAENDSDEGRAKNRRVVMVVMAALEQGNNDRIYEFDKLKDKMAGIDGG